MNSESSNLRVVLDSNVYVSAFSDEGSISFKVWQSALDRKYHLLTSPYIVRESVRILRKKFSLSEERIDVILRLMCRKSEIIQPTTSLNAVPNDPKDNPIIDCAVEGKAHLIVTGDHKHLLPLNPFQGIGILTPVDFLRTLGINA